MKFKASSSIASCALKTTITTSSASLSLVTTKTWQIELLSTRMLKAANSIHSPSRGRELASTLFARSSRVQLLNLSLAQNIPILLMTAISEQLSRPRVVLKAKVQNSARKMRMSHVTSQLISTRIRRIYTRWWSHRTYREPQKCSLSSTSKRNKMMAPSKFPRSSWSKTKRTLVKLRRTRMRMTTPLSTLSAPTAKNSEKIRTTTSKSRRSRSKSSILSWLKNGRSQALIFAAARKSSNRTCTHCKTRSLISTWVTSLRVTATSSK